MKLPEGFLKAFLSVIELFLESEYFQHNPDFKNISVFIVLFTAQWNL